MAYNTVALTRLKEALLYNPETGEIVRSGCGGKAFASKVTRGYLAGELDGVKLRAHRVAWAMHYDQWPDGDVDHIDGDTSNNAISNLRLASNQQNQWNTKARAGSSSFKGVSWKAADKKWQVRVTDGARTKHVGYYADEVQAARAYDEAAKRYHGQFARLNFGG